MSPTPRRRRLSVHTLEDRVVPAVGDLLHTFVPPGFNALTAGEGLFVNDQYVVIGDARNYTSGTTAGAVHLYDRTTRAFIKTIHNPTPAEFDFFGGDVAASGDYLVVTTAWDDTDGTDTGMIYVFRISTGELLHSLHNPTPRTDGFREFFATDVVILGDTIYSGAFWDDQHGGMAAGAMYRWRLSTGEYLGELNSPHPNGFDDFGYAVDANSRWIAVGAALDEPTGPTADDIGAVHLYDAVTGNYVRSVYNPEPTANETDYFGAALDLDGDMLVVGAELHDDGVADSDRGAVFAFNAATGEYLRKFSNPGPTTETNDRIGMSVALANGVVLAGTPWDNTAGSDTGIAYAFDLATGVLVDTLDNPGNPNNNGWFGRHTFAYGDRLYISSQHDGPGKVYEFQGAPGNPPDAINDTPDVVEDSTAARINVLANDTAAVPAQLAATAVTQPQHGTVAISADGKAVEYTPAANYVGSDSFTYTATDAFGSDTATVNVTVTPVNDPPDAIADSAEVAEDSPGTVIRVRDNDTDEFPEGLSISAITQPQHGTADIVFDNSRIEYIPTPNYSGPDSFTYTVTDGEFTDTVTVTVTVTPVNDPPTANDDAATVAPDSDPTPVNVLANDTIAPDAGETLTITAVTQPAHGTVAISGTGTGLTYTPAEGYTGPDSFTYTISDGNGGSDTAAVNLTVAPIPGNTPPTAVVDGATTVEDAGPLTIDVLANDSTIPDTGETLAVRFVTTAAHGTATIAADRKSVVYTPDPNFAGTDTFYYVVGDGRGERASAAVVVTVTNDAADRLEVVPSAIPLAYTEGDGEKPLDGGLQIGSAVGDLVTKAVVRFSAGYVTGRDSLAFVPANGIKGKFSPATGTLTITGKAPPDVYEAALRSVQYLNRSDNPVGGSRTVSVTVYDAAGAGSPGLRRVQVTAVNDGPTVTLPATAVAVKVGRPAAVLAGIELTDPDSATGHRAFIRIGNSQSGDELRINGLTSGTVGGIAFSFSGGVLTLTGPATLATYVKVLKLVKLTATTVGLRTLEVVVDDGLLESVPASRSVVVG